MLDKYFRYAVIGAVVGISAILLREGIAWFLPDEPIYFALSVGFIYALGIVLSFILQQTFTFRPDQQVHSWRKLLPFIVVALIGAVATLLLALLYRYGFAFDRLFGGFGPALAFAAATLTSSVLSFWLNARFVFRIAK